MQVAEILYRKGKGISVFAVNPECSVREAAAMITARNIGAALVTDSDGFLVGILSERDIVRSLTQHGGSSLELQVGDLMTRSVVTCAPEASVNEALSLMATHRFRHLPVMRDSEILGLVSVRDVLEFRLEGLEQHFSALRDAQEYLQDAVDNIAEPFVLFDRNEQLILCNEGYVRLYPGSEDVLVPGTTFEQILRDGLERRRYVDAIGREEEWLRNRLKAHRNPTAPHETHLSDGRWILVSDQRMRCGGVAGLRVDITRLKQAESNLRQLMDNLDRAQRLAHMGSAVRNFETDITEWSRETYRIFGVTRETFDPTTDNFLTMVIPEDRPQIRAMRRTIDAGRTPEPIEYRIRRPDGEIRHIYRVTEIVRNAEGRAVGMISTLQDLTEMRVAQRRQSELEKQLQHSQKLEALGALAGGIAHELNNALMPVLVLSKMIQAQLPSDDPHREDLSIVVAASERAKGLVKHILAFSRKQDAPKTQVDLVEVVRQSLQMLRATLPATVRIRQKISPVPALLGNANELEQVVVNLVNNAAHAIGEGMGTITVGVGRVDSLVNNASEEVGLWVKDTGCGMDAKTLDRIFEPFFTTKGVGEGTGLGLSVLHGIIVGHGGRMEVHSEVGKGTTFSIYLPVSTTINAPAEIAELA